MSDTPLVDEGPELLPWPETPELQNPAESEENSDDPQ